MKNILFYLIVLLCMFWWTDNQIYANDQNQQNSSSIGYLTDIDTAMTLARETKQDLIIIFSASWCGHCAKLKNDLPNILELDNKIICVLDNSDHKKFFRQMRIKSLPTSILIDTDGKEISRIEGYEKLKYIQWIKSL